MSEILYGSEAWCLKYSKMGMLQRTERSAVRAMCRVQLKDRKRAKDLMLLLCLNEAINQLAMANSVRWCDHVLRRRMVMSREWYYILRLKVKGIKGEEG